MKGGAKISYSKAGIAKEMGISQQQLQSKLNKAARKGKKLFTFRRSALTRALTSTRGVKLSTLKRQGVNVSAIKPEGTVRTRKQTRVFTLGNTRSGTRKATTSRTDNTSMAIPFNAGPLTDYLQRLNSLLQNIEANYLNPNLTTQMLRNYITEVKTDLGNKTRGITKESHPVLKGYVGQQFGRINEMYERVKKGGDIQVQRQQYRMAQSQASKSAADNLAGMFAGLLAIKPNDP